MKLCKDCKNRDKKRNCKFYSSTSNYAERCIDFEKIKPTNAESIRSMNDDELKKFLGTFDFCLYCKASEQVNCSTDDCKKYREEGLMEWLQSEVER